MTLITVGELSSASWACPEIFERHIESIFWTNLSIIPLFLAKQTEKDLMRRRFLFFFRYAE
jgi:hypothetical protein